MRRGQWLVYIWPGLPDVWRHGSWPALAVACGFACLLNLTLAASLIWTEWIGSDLRFAAWTALAILWAVAAWSALRQAGKPVEHAEGLFSRATGEYLQGNWFEAERLFSQLVKQNRHDVDALLMLATLYRRTTRHEEARELLDRLPRLEDAEKWQPEIEREQRLLARSIEEADEEPADIIPMTAATPDRGDASQAA